MWGWEQGSQALRPPGLGSCFPGTQTPAPAAEEPEPRGGRRVQPGHGRANPQPQSLPAPHRHMNQDPWPRRKSQHCPPPAPHTLGDAQFHLQVHGRGDHRLRQHQHVLQPDHHHQVGEDLAGGGGEGRRALSPNTRQLYRPGQWRVCSPRWVLSNPHSTGQVARSRPQHRGGCSLSPSAALWPAQD